MKSRRRNHRSKWAHVNTPEGLRRRRAKADARREAMAATLPPPKMNQARRRLIAMGLIVS